MGNITKVDDQTRGPRGKTFQYDGLNRLTSAVAMGLWGTETYTYDPINNLRTRLTAGQTSIYNYDANNKLLNITRGGSTIDSFGYDPRGNVTNRNGVSLLFDAKNQLTQIPDFDSYLYDASGRRVEKTPASGGASTFYLYDGAGQLMYQYAPAQSQATNFIHLGTRLIADNVSLLLSQPGAVTFDPNPNNGNYTVSWGAVPLATSYTLQQSANGGDWSTVYTGSAASVALSGRDGGSYVYQVEANATDSGQIVHSGWTLSATLGVRPAIPVVSAPTGLNYVTYTVSWAAPIGATTYTVQERLDGGPWSTIANGIAATSVSRPGTVGGTYDYQVSANNSYGARGWSTPVSVQILGNPDHVGFDTNPNNGDYTVNWGAVVHATSYILQERSADGGAWTTKYTGSTTTKAFAGHDGGGYIYQVQACAGSVCSGLTTSVTLGVTPTIPIVSGPTTLVFGAYTVSWTAPIGATSYDVQESLDGGAWATIASNTAAVSIVRPGTVGGNYTYRVTAKNAYGNRGWSAAISVAVTQIPDVPTDFVPVTGSDGTYVQLTWDAMRFATSYQLTQYQTGVNLGFQTFLLTATSYNVPDLPPNGVIFELKACSIAGCSAAVKIGGDPRLTAPAPTVSGPSTLVFGTYAVSWTAMTNIVYDVQEKLGDGDWVTIASHTASTSITRPGTTGGNYQYRVSAWNTFGSRGWSDPITVAVTQVPNTPTNFVFSSDDNGVSVMSWDAMPFATSYVVTVAGTHGSLQTYTYTVGDPSFVLPAGNYKVTTLKACSIAGCSMPVQVIGGGGLGNTAMRGKAKPRGMDTGPSTEPSGCTATSCQAIIGGTP